MNLKIQSTKGISLLCEEETQSVIRRSIISFQKYVVTQDPLCTICFGRNLEPFISLEFSKLDMNGASSIISNCS